MKYVKIFGLLAVAAAALMAFAGSASATTITGGNNHETAKTTEYTGEIQATSEGTAVLENPIAEIKCHSTVVGTSLTHGSGVTAEGAIETLVWGTSGNTNGKCHEEWHVTTGNPGTLQIHWKAAGEGTLTSTNATVSATIFGITCNYKTNATDIGTLTDSSKTGGTATLDVNALIPIEEETSSPFCGKGSAKWEGSYKINTPDTLYINP